MPHSKDTGTVVRLVARGLPHVAGPADRGPEKPLTVLVIDDSPEDRMILRFALEASGFVLLEAGSGRNGIVQVSAQTPDCILLDHRLPDIEGLDVLEQLRRPDGQLPCAVVMLTGSDDAAVATAAMKAGALDFIVKDHLHHDSLRRAIRNAMYQFRLAAEHRQAEQRNAHLAAIVSASGDAIVSLEADGARVRSWSPGATQVFGYSEAEAIGRSIDELIVPEHLEEERPQLFAALRSGRQAIVIDTVRRHKSGHLIPVEINASPMLDSGGGIMGYSVIFRDVSERRRAEARFAAIRQALSGGADGEQGAPVAETRSLGLPGDRSAARIMAAHSAALFDAPREWAFDQITQLASCMLQAPVSLLTVIDARRQFFVSAHGLPRLLDTARETPLGLSYCRYVVESGAPVAITDASCNPLVSAIGAWQQGFVSYLGVPVFDHTGEVIASLSVGDATPRAWTRQDRSMLEGIARLLTRELENRAMLRERRRNEEALRLQSERLTLLLDVTSALVGRSLDQAALGRIVFERIGAALQADSCFNYRLDPNSGGLELVFASGVPADRLETVQRIEFGQAFCGTVAETSEGILADAQRIATDPKAAFVAGLGIRAYACHPIRASDGRLLGTFALASTTRESYAAEDGALLQTVTNVLGQAWDRIAHERALRESETRLRVLGDSLPDSAVYQYAHDAEGRSRFLYISAGVERLNGTSVESVLGDAGTLLGQIPPEHRERFLEAEGRSARALADFEIEVPMRRTDGELRWMRLKARPQRLPDGGTLWNGVQTDITERKRSEEALRESEHRLRLAMEAAATGLWDWDIASNHVRWSPECYAIHGLREGEFDDTAAGFDRLLHPEDKDRVWATVRAAADRQTNYECEFRIVRPSGEVRWVANLGRAICDAAGRPLRMIGTITDITERKQREHELRDSEERFRATFQNAAVGVAQVAPDGRWLRVNERLCHITGYPAEELLSRRFQDITHPDDLDADLTQVQRMLDGEIDTYGMEKRYLCKNGGTVWINLTVGCVRNGEGAIEYFIGVIEDITDRKRAEAALRDSEERFRSIVTTAQEGIWAVDRDGRTVIANPRLAELLGTTPEAMAGKQVPEFCFDEDVEEARARMTHNFAGRAQEFEFRFRRSDGSPIHVLAATTPLRGHDGTVIGALGGFVDLGERKRAEERQRVLMHELAHRGRNLLAVVQSIASLTLSGGSTLAEAREAFTGRLQALAHTYGSLLDEEHQGALLGDIIAAELASFGSRAQVTGARIVVAAKVAQTFALIVHELATNAAKYGSLSVPSGRLTISWGITDAGPERRFVFDWRETDGPPARAPTRRGFGSKLISAMAASEFRCTPEVLYGDEGFRYRLEAPLAAIEAGMTRES